MVAEGYHRRQKDGLNSMNYEQLSLTPLDLYTLVYVRVNKTEVLQVGQSLLVSEIFKFELQYLSLDNIFILYKKIIKLLVSICSSAVLCLNTGICVVKYRY